MSDVSSANLGNERVLYGYWRSSAAYRVRIALHHKNLPFENVPVSLAKGEQRSAEHLARNPQGLVPALVDRGATFTQSLAICEYLDEAYPDTPRLLPSHPAERAGVRAMAQLVACDIHPLCNLRVLNYLEAEFGQDAGGKKAWVARWLHDGLAALETLAEPVAGDYLFGDTVTLADVFLAPQLYNARRFDVDLAPYPLLRRIDETLTELPSFRAAEPSRQPDAQ
ncbi:maleylacetoacetate isomerase [Crenobacter cavernae]|uniref:Maleylacetoacetate isomerase n=1 Tax=Crenobacter cavernae TaxID=2290923 RepID=A0ABY0FEZ4_9NEIS|nr:maleylacetoacetate isomerase [Crenobacter cavernae]RXZ44872.1 maleylacetoacetate isomerase [Crenobacter cavernae]